MCGIAGILNLTGTPPAPSEVHAMCRVLRHRGPDDEGVYLEGNVGLGMRRLKIIDLETGHQPVSNETGTLQVVLNGEIYNYQALRKDLEARGHVFRTRTDTETIVHLYEEYGPQCVTRLRGMFAFALWDEPRRQLMLARDRLGIKPLFYGLFDGRLVFASELKALLQLPEVDRQINWRALAHLAAFLSTPADESILEGIRKLEPGHLLTMRPGQMPHVERYWRLEFAPLDGWSEEDLAFRLREVIDESVRLHMVSDVPIGAFLSGGVDSSAVLASMARQSARPIETFSVGFHEAPFNELPYARAVATRFGTTHHELIVEPTILDTLDDLVWHLDEPFGDSSAIPTFVVSRLASEHVTVVLSGDGGDELFAGYDKYRVEMRERRYDRLPTLVHGALGAVAAAMPDQMTGRRFLRHFSMTGWRRYLDASTLFPSDTRRKLFQGEAFERMRQSDPVDETLARLARSSGGHWLSTVQGLDVQGYLPLDILTKVDRMSMAHSIEARVPLLDHEVVEFAARIPPTLQMANGSGKHLFKQSLRGILPDEILDRRKQGFAVPLGRWFNGQLSRVVRDILISPRTRQRGILDLHYVERLLDWHAAGRSLDLHLWTLLSFELWCRMFLDRPAARPATAARHHVQQAPAAAGVSR
jgi:asparagine synthase (glutamine-hydrolysing)